MTRVVLLLAALVAILTTLVILLFPPPQAAPEEYVVTPEHEERLIDLDREAVEEAYRLHVRGLFTSWLKDSIDQPERAKRGVMRARAIYERAMRGIEMRE